MQQSRGTPSDGAPFCITRRNENGRVEARPPQSLGAGRSLFRRSRQRRRLVGERIQVSQNVGALSVLRNTGKTHRGARNVALRVGDELVEVVDRPGAALGLHGTGEVESAAFALLVANDAI